MFYIILCVSLCCILQLTWTASTDYCSMCDPKGSHTMCTYQAGPSTRCNNYRNKPLNEKEKISLLNFHNELRSKIAIGNETRGDPGPQPTASNMRQLSWDEELSEVAQRWADQCIPFDTKQPHDKCRDSERFRVGQNIATDMSSPPEDLDVIIQATRWYDEVRDFNAEWTKSFIKIQDPQKKVGHYTQFVWGKTYLVGCGRVMFDEYQDNEIYMLSRIVCNYAPTGNILSSPLYKIGPQCSACPEGTTCNPFYGGLCATKEQMKKPIIGESKPAAISEGKLAAIGESKPTAISEGKPAAISEGKPDAIDVHQFESTKKEQTPIKRKGSSNTTIQPKDGSYLSIPLYKYKRGVWLRGACFCPVDLRSRASVIIHFCSIFFAILILMTN